MALRQLQAVKKLDPSFRGVESRLFHLVQVMQRQKRIEVVLRYSDAYLRPFAERGALIRLNVARVFAIEQARPRKAMKVLADVPRGDLNANGRQVFERLRTHCQNLIAEGSIEPGDSGSAVARRFAQKARPRARAVALEPRQRKRDASMQASSDERRVIGSSNRRLRIEDPVASIFRRQRSCRLRIPRPVSARHRGRRAICPRRPPSPFPRVIRRDGN